MKLVDQGRLASPFIAYVDNILSVIVLTDEDTLEHNEFYCPEAFEAINDVIHLYPLWAAAL
jgi:hypothetical protein